ncbi:MAG: DUF5666 domain-containing protein [Myxococcota bacterium]
MTERRRRLAIALLALIVFAPRLGAAAESCGLRLGEPLHVLEPGDDESGIGGTGVAPERGAGRTPDRGREDVRGARGGDDDDSGLGGTGRGPDDSGLGGTGRGPDDGGPGRTGRGPDERGVGLFGRAEPVGTTTDRGGRGGARVCVSGLEVAIPEGLALEASDGVGAVATTRGITAGQLVFVEATRTIDGFVATRIVLAGDGAGRLAGRTDDGVWRIDGRRLRIGPGTARDASLDETDLAAGQWIAFQAQLGPDGDLVATRIARSAEGQTRAPDTSLESALPERLREARSAGRIDYASIEGFFARDGARARVGRVTLRLPPRGGDGPPRALRAGARVRVGGRIDAEGGLRVMPPRPARPRGGAPTTPTPPPQDRPPSADPSTPRPPQAVPPRPPRDEVQPPPRPVRPRAPRDVPRPATRPKVPTVDRVPTR